MTTNLDKNIKDISKPIRDIAEKIINNHRLSYEDGIRLYKSNDILSIGRLADHARINRLKLSGDTEKAGYVYWIHNHHLNLTNICEGKCKFCAYRRKYGEEGAFFLTVEQATEHVEKNAAENISEIHIVSALNPKLDLNYYVKLIQNIEKILPNTHIQALTAVEIDYIANISGLSIKDTLIALKNAGLGSLPGGGAEIFSAKIREEVCPEKISGEKWLEIMEIAHNLGLKSNATMLSGIGETYEDKIDHMLKIREVQDSTNGFMTFIPLFCHYDNTEIAKQEEPTGFDIIKEYAISRLMLDNIPHIKAFWIQIGIKMAQLTLSFGVDDLDGTVVEEKITHYAGAKTGQAISKNEIVHLIKNSGKRPVERDTIYNILKVYE